MADFGASTPTAPPGAVLCLHGFTGSPLELAPVAARLESDGWKVASPALHGVDDGDEDAGHWLEVAESALMDLYAASGRPVALVGASMGALLAIQLASRRPECVGPIVLMATPLRLRWHEATALAVWARLPAVLRAAVPSAPKLGGIDVADPDARRALPARRTYPLQSLISMLPLMAAASAGLPRLRTPVMVVHGRRDRTVPAAHSEEVAARVGSAVVERLWLEQSGHLVGVDADRAALADAIAMFLSRHSGQVS